MKIFGDYLRRHLGGIGIFLACCGIFVLVFSLYDLPAEAVLYGGVLSADGSGDTSAGASSALLRISPAGTAEGSSAAASSDCAAGAGSAAIGSL